MKFKYYGVALLMVFCAVILIFEIGIRFRVRHLSDPIQTPAANVVRAYKLKDLTTPYWENSFSDQCAKIKVLDQKLRLEFFLFVSKNCDFCSYRGLIFQSELGVDRAALFKKVHDEILKSNRADRDSLNQILFWIE